MEISGGEASPVTSDLAARRGPMRPERLISVRQSRHRRLKSHLFAAVDRVVVILGALVALAQHGRVLDVPLRETLPILVGSLATVWILRAAGGYRFRRSGTLADQLGRVAVALGAAAVLSELCRYAVHDHAPRSIDRGWLLGATVLLLCLHTGRWWRVQRWHTAGLLTPNLVVVGATSHAEAAIATALERRHVNILGIFDDRLERTPRDILGVPVLGPVDALLGHRILPYVDRIVVAIDPEATRRSREISAQLAVLPNEVTLLLDPSESAGHRGVISRIVESELAAVKGALDLDHRVWAKRVQDLVVGVPMLLAFSPLLALLALLVRLDSPGPVFFRQVRHGFNNEEFRVWKFRTMRAESTDSLAVRQVTVDDDRVTRVGRILRKTSLDELPQLVNVIRGEMSLVGPRPHAVGMRTGDVESAALVADYAHRHRIKPGMTGWAAVNGSRGPLHAIDDVRRRVALDVDYIERQSLGMDLRIMLLTVPGMLGDRRAVR